MPFYRFGFGLAHIRMANTKKQPLPAHCVAPHLWPDGVTRACLAMSSALCDFELSDGATCDMPICAEHALEVGPDRHYCPKHR